MSTEVRPASRALTAAAAAGPVLLAAAAVVMLAAAAAGRHPFWRPEVLNMAEAAAARDVSTVAALIERGEDPNVPQLVRPPLLDGVNRAMTPLEAGVVARRMEVVGLLLAHGAAPGPEIRLALVCEALHNGDNDIAAALAGGPPAVECPR